MESRSVPSPDPAAARAALDDVAAAEAQVAARVRTPWWYRVGMALCMGVAVADQGVGDTWQVRWGLHMPWAMVVAGIGAFLLTLIMEPRIDDAARRKLRTTQ